MSFLRSTQRGGGTGARRPDGGRSGRSSPHSSSSRGRLSVIFLCGLSGVLGFSAGLLVASGSTAGGSSEQIIRARVQEEVRRQLQQHRQQRQDHDSGGDETASARFPEAVQDFAAGLATVDRDDFMAAFDVGVPQDLSSKRNGDVLLLYQSAGAVPDADALLQADILGRDGTTTGTAPLPRIPSAREATRNCDFLNILLTDHSGERRRQCTAVVGQYEAFHLQKFMRLPIEKGKLDPALPLRYVNRGAQSSGRLSTQPATREETEEYWARLQSYLASLDGVLEELKPLLQQVAVRNTVTVLVCNYGQSELLLNFVCGARHRRGLDLSRLLVFATDVETRDLVRAADIAVFYDPTNYGDAPKRAAGRYGDSAFMAMMLAKVYCVHMVTWLGYDVLFQDVDVIWYRDPLPYFHANDDAAVSGFDIYFQDDGNHALFYAPYSANTGFYYVRANERTRHLFNSFVLQGDLILSTHSHQIPLVALLQEHASMYGLRVKIFSRTEDDFPGGHAFHRRKDFMRDIISGRKQPYIFHMSWTNNKTNKIKFFRQLGEWYLKDQCVQKKVDEIAMVENDWARSCCADEAIFSCHYKDKPSKLPCRDSPAIDEGRPSWW